MLLEHLHISPSLCPEISLSTKASVGVTSDLSSGIEAPCSLVKFLVPSASSLGSSHESSSFSPAPHSMLPGQCQDFLPVTRTSMGTLTPHFLSFQAVLYLGSPQYCKNAILVVIPPFKTDSIDFNFKKIQIIFV